MKLFKLAITSLVVTAVGITAAHARELDYKPGEGEIEVWVNPGEPTEIQFPGKVAGGFQNSNSGLAIEKKDESLIIFAKETMDEEKGAAILVRLQDGRPYPLRIRKASVDNPRDPVLSINDPKGIFASDEEEEEPPYKEREFPYAGPSKVAGLMREMVLVSEFGKKKITGYTISDKYKGQTVVSDGTVLAKVETIIVGPNLWGYVLDTTNLLDQQQRLNPATFRIDGTRAVSASNWELAARPINVEEQIAGKHNTKIYIVTRAK